MSNATMTAVVVVPLAQEYGMYVVDVLSRER